MLNIGLGKICELIDKNPKAGFLSQFTPVSPPSYAGFSRLCRPACAGVVRRKKDGQTEVNTPSGAL